MNCNCILPRARRPAVALMLLLTLVHQTTSSNVALQQLEEDGYVVQGSQLRKKPRQVMVEVEEKEKEDKAASSSTFQSHAQYLEGDKDFFEFESQQEVQLTKRNLSIFDAAEETDNNETAPIVVVVSEDVDCDATTDENECNLDYDDCEWFVDEVTGVLMCFINDIEEKNDTSSLDYKANPSNYPDVSYDYEDAKDEDENEEKSSKSGKQGGREGGLADDSDDDESGRKLKRRKYDSSSDGVISVITETEREQDSVLQLIDEVIEALESAENLFPPTRESSEVQLAEVRAAVASK